MRFFIDTNIPMYATGTEHAYRDPCRKVIKAIAAESLDAVTDAEVFQEILCRYLYINRRETGLQVFDRFHTLMEGKVMPVTMREVNMAREMVNVYPALSPRDLIHLAVMVHHRITHIISTDRVFDTVPTITRVDPATF